jgi:RNA polymerase sigma-70 factor (ECF subfamily)
MAGLETTLGGSREHFPDTVWSSLLGTPGPESPERKAALDQFFALYWRPVYKFVRTAGKASIEDAKDLTQEFFRYLLEGGLLAKYQASKGRFRSYLKGILRNFLSQAHRDGNAQKRGGGKAVLSLDVGAVETDGFLAERERLTPDEIFDRQWATEILLRCIADLRRALTGEGRLECLRVYEAYELCPEGQDPPTYGELARALSLTEHQVKNHLDAARARLEQLVRERLSRGVTSPRELAQEMNELFSG